MRLMLYEWHGFMQRDLEEVLKTMHIDYRVFIYSFLSTADTEDKYFEKFFKEALKSGEYDGVFSLNFWPVVAKCCHELNLPYISWVYDSPVIVDGWGTALKYPTSYCFVFDRGDYVRLTGQGFRVFHMLLGSNLERLDHLLLSGEEKNKYRADVSFVGQLYSTNYNLFFGNLSEYDKGCLESIIETQLRIYGSDYLEEMMDDDLKKVLLRQLEEIFAKSGKNCSFEHLKLLLSKEITCRERTMILYLLSQYCHVVLYSDKKQPLLQDVAFGGTVDSYEEIHRVFRSSKINLNITFKGITKGIPYRAMEIMGSGSFLLSNWQEELAENFRPGVDCVMYESIEDAAEKVRYFLAHDDERERIAANGHEAMKRFTFEKQLRKIFSIVSNGVRNGGVV